MNQERLTSLRRLPGIRIWTLATLVLPCSTLLAEESGSVPTTLPYELPSVGWAVARMIGVLAILLVGAWCCLRWLRGGRGLGGLSGTARWIEVVDQYRLEPRKTLYLVKIRGQFMLIGSGESHLTSLTCPPLDQDVLQEAWNEDRKQDRLSGRPPLAQSFLDLLRHGRSASGNRDSTD